MNIGDKLDDFNEYVFEHGAPYVFFVALVAIAFLGVCIVLGIIGVLPQ